MRVLVINPWIVDFKLYDEWMHPAGLYLLISLLRGNGCEVSYLNCLERGADSPDKRFSTGDFSSVVIEKPPVYTSIPRRFKRYGIPPDEFNTRLHATGQPDAVCIGSAMTYWLPGVMQTINSVRTVWPGVPVICGGIGATLFPGFIKAHAPDVHLFTASLAGTDGRCTLPVIGELHSHGRDWSLLDGLSLATRHHHGPVLSSLGCPMSCTYCASRILHPGYAQRPVTTVVGEIRYLHEQHGVTDFAFYDDALLHGNAGHLLTLLQSLRDTRISGLRLHTPNGMHLAWITDPILEAMRNAGFVTMRFGYESSHASHATATSGKSSRIMAAEKLAMVRKHGFDKKNTGVYVMAGLDGQTPEGVVDDLRFIHSLGVQAKPVFISPVPGTPLFDTYAARFPLLLTDPYRHNDMFFITQLDGWDWGTAEGIRGEGKRLNSTLVNDI